MRECSDEMLDSMFAAARADVVDTSALGNHFENRLLARITERRDQGRNWFMSVWRMLPAFAVLTALIAVCSIAYTETYQDSMFTALTTGQDEVVASNILTGE